jgi:hypothetical protein
VFVPYALVGLKLKIHKINIVDLLLGCVRGICIY